jgi:hypothetical protein
MDGTSQPVRREQLRHGRQLHAVERTDLRVAVPEAVFEVSEASAGCSAATITAIANVPYRSREMPGFRFTAERFYRVGFPIGATTGRADPDCDGHGGHLLLRRPRTSTVHDAPDAAEPSSSQGPTQQAARHSDKGDLVESRRLLRSANPASRAADPRTCRMPSQEASDRRDGHARGLEQVDQLAGDLGAWSTWGDIVSTSPSATISIEPRRDPQPSISRVGKA